MAKPDQFRFDKKLWLRFIKVAQPYFFPVASRQTRVFLGLIPILLLAVLALSFFLIVGLTFLGQAIFSEFLSKAAPELTDRINNSLNSPTFYIALGTVFVSGLAFFSQRHKLKERWLQWSLLGLLLFLLFASTGIKITISYALRFITTALNQRNAEDFWQSVIILAIIFLIATPIFVIYKYTQKKLGVLWREWLSKDCLHLYFHQQAYYQSNCSYAQSKLDNPDQRIAQDIESFTTVTLNLILQLLDSFITLFSFVAILYGISKTLAFGLLFYSISGTIIAILIGNRMIGINYNQFSLEANFRYSLIRVRENAESIAFYQGEQRESKQVVEGLFAAIKNFNLLIIWEAFIDLFQKSYEYLILLFPYLIIAPLYFKGEVEFGEFTQADFAFATLLYALSFVVNRVQWITGYAASINRLGEFYEVFENPETWQNTTDSSIEISQIDYENSSQINLQNLTVKTPDFMRILVKNLSVSIPTNQNLLVVGSSGSGKSSLLRAIAELWTSGTGMIGRPQLEEMLFLPQRPYMIVGTLREQLLYPHFTQNVDDDWLQYILETVQLPHLSRRFKGGFDAEESWENILSLGEQQRIAFARVLISQPRYAVLDEATSALDIDNEQALYQTLSHQGTTYISVGHRTTLRQYHQQLLQLFEGGEWELQTINH
ncbi:MAG: ABC transporter ATP-binding protein/permease [Limnoraphis sp. WC205]|jgi:putative ATP-binding cassette transporter|nr:ABC transporter ATP-binding protein/permease [Limnoraphis sp. WC205]